jgi:iron complex outermembrane recepter protein
MVKKGKLTNFCTRILLALGYFCIAFPAHSSEPSNTARSGTIIEEVLVSATKRESSLQDTGIAISVIGAEEMKFRDINNLEDFQNSVPSMRVGTVSSIPLITIRGVGLNVFIGAGSPGVATHYDGVYLARAASTVMSTVDLSRIEVLRGPQGTLYGRNATGGSVNFMAKKPGDVFTAGVTAGAGDYGRVISEAFIDTPLTDRFKTRAYWRKDEFDGYGINETTGDKIGGNTAESYRLSFDYQLSDSLDIFAGYTRRDDEGANSYTSALTSVTAIGQVKGNSYPTSEQSFKPYNIKGLRNPQEEKYTSVANIEVNWQLGDYDFKSITGYVQYVSDAFYSAPEIERFVVYFTRNDDTETWSQEFNFSGAWFDGTLNWLIGAYYLADDSEVPQTSYINLDEIVGVTLPTGSTLVFPPTSIMKDRGYAFFLDGYWSVLDELRIVFGARHSEEKRQFTQTFLPYVENRLGGQLVSDLSGLLLAFQPVIETCENETNDASFSSFDPKLGIEWDIADEAMIYAQYQTGFKAGGFNGGITCNQVYDPEEIASLEVGVKSSWLDNTLTLNLAAFDYDYSDYQVDKLVGLNTVVENAASAISRGFELEGSYTPSAWLKVDLTYSYLDATYDNYFSVDHFNDTSVIQADAPVENLKGNRLSRSPENSFNIGATFTLDINRYYLGLMSLRLEGYYSDDVYFREFNRDNERQEAYSTYNAFLSLSSTDDLVTLSVFAKNLGDERYLVGEIPFDTVKYKGGYYAPPRTLGATLSLRL